MLAARASTTSFRGCSCHPSESKSQRHRSWWGPSRTVQSRRRKERKGKEKDEYLYSANYTMHSLKAFRHGSQFYLQITQCPPFLRKRSPDGATPNWGSRHPIAAYYSFIDPEEMKGWVGLVDLYDISNGLVVYPHKSNVLFFFVFSLFSVKLFSTVYLYIVTTMCGK